MSHNLLNFSQLELDQFVRAAGEPSFRAQQLGQWIHQHRVVDFDQMTNISKSFRQYLKKAATVRAPDIVAQQQASEGTCKWILKLEDGNAIETVYIPEASRGTLCISSQVGCTLNCRFCATGKEGFNRNLSLAEIIGQLWIAKRYYNITNVVMMGMGEPLLNYEPVKAALEWMLADHAYGLSKHRVTVSTAGVIPKMEELKKDLPVSLAVSLHAPNNNLRNHLVPLNKKYPLERLIPVCRNYFPQQGKQKVLFEYVMLDNINDSQQHVSELIHLLKGVSCKINLIPFNPFPATEYKPSSDSAIHLFQSSLVKAGFNTRVRRQRGDEIAAACGQLAGNFVDRTQRRHKWWLQRKSIPIIPVQTK